MGSVFPHVGWDGFIRGSRAIRVEAQPGVWNLLGCPGDTTARRGRISCLSGMAVWPERQYPERSAAARQPRAPEMHHPLIQL